jgi:hypothetical protein
MHGAVVRGGCGGRAGGSRQSWRACGSGGVHGGWLAGVRLVR